MYATPFVRSHDAIITARAQRASFVPSNCELEVLMRPIYGRALDAVHRSELAVARLVFAQVALMAGAALAADSETFFGAEQLWRDMQQKIGVQERALARRFLELLARDTYYSESERRLIGVLAHSISGGTEWRVTRRASPAEHPQPPFALSPIQFSESTVERLRAQRDSITASQRELMLLFQAEFGQGRSTFRAGELEGARVLFAQVVLMVGSLLAADTETYLGAEQMWSGMQRGAHERALAGRILGLLAKDTHYTESERQLIRSLAGTLSG